jgi:sterol desaturase/sphingolipid hydroxylase (fatty acid hydroxylase superfamily)
VDYVAHPLFLTGALGLWWAMGRGEGAALVALVVALLTMGALERRIPAVPQWRQRSGEKVRLAGVYAAFLVLHGVVVAGYQGLLQPALFEFGASTGLSTWLTRWPILVQVLVLYFASDFIYYWIHRGIHHWSWLWRASGHGFHHAFHNLHAINVGATHPFEVFLLALPMVSLAAVFAATAEAVAGAAVLIVVNATLAHANLRMGTPLFSWLFTSSNEHRRHHSVVFEESNTNYACNAILWDHLFGTHSSGPVRETGIGPREPELSEMLMLPFREPRDVDTVATRAQVPRKG